jgi:hypothetical protein
MTRLLTGAALLGAGIAALATGAPARGAPIVIAGWPAVTAEFGGSTLVWATTVTNRLRGFDYWSAEVSRVRVARGGPSGAPETPVVVRTQAGPFGPVGLSTGADGSFVLVARGRGFPPPVVWCCDTRGLEVVMESDGRDIAPRALAAGVDGLRVRTILATTGATALVTDDPLRLTDDPAADRGRARPRAEAPFPSLPTEALASISGTAAVWVDPGAPGVINRGTLSDTGVTEGPALTVPGSIMAVWTRADAAAVAYRSGSGVTVAHVDLQTGVVRTVARASGVPPVALGRGIVAVAAGRRVLAGPPERLTEVRRAAGPVAALATDGARVAIFERSRSRTGARTTALRLARVGG